jgi:hypothetical protein
MGLLSTLLGVPVTGPINGTGWVLRKLYETAHEEFYDPASIKRQLVALETQLDAGEITEEQFEEIELALLHRLREAASGTGRG